MTSSDRDATTDRPSDPDITVHGPFGPASEAGEVVAVRRDLGAHASMAANRTWWDDASQEYYAEHGDFLGDDDLVWGPEGVRESDLRLLGDLAGADVLEIGGGAAQGARWVAGRGARVVSSDLSMGMLRRARGIDAAQGGPPVPLAQADGRVLPFADATFDVVFSAHGVLAFVADPEAVSREVHRVLRPGGRAVFSTPHPVRWCFPDDPGPAGLRATMSYWDTTPYVEMLDGVATYAEHHRTLGQRIRDFVAAGLTVLDVVEPEWPDETVSTWGGWSPLRGGILPGTCIYVLSRPA